MVSVFVSSTFGFGLELTDDELERVNERRRSEKWSKYLSKDKAREGYDTTKKKVLIEVVGKREKEV